MAKMLEAVLQTVIMIIVAMSMAIAAGACKNDVIIKNAEAVNKSYPTFFDDFKRRKGVFDVIELRE